MVTRLDSAPIEGVGARDTDRLQDVVERDAAVVATGDGAHVALVLVQKLVMARRTDHVPDLALYITKTNPPLLTILLNYDIYTEILEHFHKHNLLQVSPHSF
jgi:hypothetical protein